MSSSCGSSTRRKSIFRSRRPAMFHDVESGREIYIDPSAARQDYLRRFAAHAAEIERSCVDLGIEYEPITTDRPLELVLFDLLEGEDAARPPAGPPDCTGTGRCSMSFLTPLYILGLAAVAAPIIFHLIRRSPRGEVPFSSLMFLSPTPPRLTRRSRLDQLALAPAAGGRALPCWRLRLPGRSCARRPNWISATSSSGGSPLLIDTSASMRRGDLWPRAQALASQVLDDCRPTDQLAVFAFDATSRPLLGFHESATARSGTAPGHRQGSARSPGADLGRDQPGSGPGRHRGRDRRRGRCQRENRPHAAPRRLDQRPCRRGAGSTRWVILNGRRMSSST